MKSLSDMPKITKIDEWTIEYVMLNYHHEWLVYKGEKNGHGEWFKTYKDAVLYIADKLEYNY